MMLSNRLFLLCGHILKLFFRKMPYSLLINIKVLPLPTRVLFNPHSLDNLFLENHCYLSWIPTCQKDFVELQSQHFKKKWFTFWHFPDIKLSYYFIEYFFRHSLSSAVSLIRWVGWVHLAVNNINSSFIIITVIGCFIKCFSKPETGLDAFYP